MSTASFPKPTSPLYEVALEISRAWNTKDWTKLGSHLAENYTHQLWPSTMRGPDQNQRIGKAAFLDVMDQLADGFIESYGLDVEHPVNVVEGKDVIVIQMSSHGVLKNGRPYDQEYLHILRFNKDNKVVSDDEWVDSACAVQAFAGMVMPAMGPDGRITNVEEAKRANSVKAE